MTQSNNETFDRFSLYFLAIFISPMLFGIFMAFYSILAFQDSWSFGPTVLVVSFYTLPFYALAAFPGSLYIDFSARTKDAPNWLKALLLAGTGGLAALLGSLVLYSPYSILLMFLFGMVGGIIHFALLVLLKKLIK